MRLEKWAEAVEPLEEALEKLAPSEKADREEARTLLEEARANGG